MAVKQSFVDILQQIIEEAKTCERMEVRRIFALLAGKGYAALLIVLSLPFCMPIQIPGFSTPFGILLAFLGLRIAFAKRLWWPKWVLNKTVTSAHVTLLVKKTIPAVRFLQKVLHPRLLILTKSSLAHRLHGLAVFFLALFLSLPLPIPMTNMLSAAPILLIGLGLLEDDGACIIVAYAIALLALAAFIGLLVFGKAIYSAI